MAVSNALSAIATDENAPILGCSASAAAVPIAWQAVPIATPWDS